MMKATIFKVISRYCFICVVSLMVFGCVTIKSVKDPGFSAKISKVYVIARGAEDAKSFMEKLGFKLQNGLQQRNITCEVYVRHSLSLESVSEIKERMIAYQPDVVLTIAQTQISFYNGAKSGGKFELTMRQPGSDKPVWKASLSSETSGYAGLGLTESIANKILSQMEKDGLL